MSEFSEVLYARTATEHYDPTVSISDLEIRELVQAATEAPSAFNVQPWRFLAVTDQALREQLKEATVVPNQKRVVDAPLSLFVLGDLDGHKNLQAILNEAVEANSLRREIADAWVGMANNMYATDPTPAKDEAIRSCSLAAMVLMLAAEDRGYVSCPIGFNAAQAKKILSISDRFVPVMWLTVGRPAPGNTPRRPRLPVEKILAFNSATEF